MIMELTTMEKLQKKNIIMAKARLNSFTFQLSILQTSKPTLYNQITK